MEEEGAEEERRHGGRSQRKKEERERQKRREKPEKKRWKGTEAEEKCHEGEKGVRERREDLDEENKRRGGSAVATKQT